MSTTTTSPFEDSPSAQAETRKAAALHTALAAVDITSIDLVSRDRNIPRKEQAKLARLVFSKLGLKGISVTAPNYSMAQSVHVRLPKRHDFTVLREDGGIDWGKDPAAKANQEAASRVGSILLAAFPNSEDRSDSMTDHFNYRWSID